MLRKFDLHPVVCAFPVASYTYYGTEKVEDNGRVVTRSVVLTDDVASRNSQLHVRDFLLENLLDQGVELKEMRMSDDLFLSHDRILSAFDEFAESRKSVNDGK